MLFVKNFSLLTDSLTSFENSIFYLLRSGYLIFYILILNINFQFCTLINELLIFLFFDIFINLIILYPLLKFFEIILFILNYFNIFKLCILIF